MVGIVVVSHSELLANGVVELANQMTQGRCRIAAAGGVDDPENPIGTDTIKIMMAIEEVYDQSGVLVLMDMGSALLSTETALELIDPDMLDNIALISAPIVEGTMAASVAASANLPLSAVIEEARGSLGAKQEHLGDVLTSSAQTETVEIEQQALRFDWQVRNPHGIHARPAAKIVSTLASFTSDTHISKGEAIANAKSLNSIAKLAIACEDTIIFHAAGTDAKDVLRAVQALAVDHFGEAHLITKGTVHTDAKTDTDNTIAQETTAPVDGILTGIPVCDGIAFGRVTHLTNTMPDVPTRTYTDVTSEQQRVDNAIEKTRLALLERQIEAENTLGKEHAEIFLAHQLMLSDPELSTSISQRIYEQQCAEQAVYAAMIDLAHQYKHSDSTYMQEREADVWDVLKQTLLSFDGVTDKVVEFTDNSIVVADDLSPSQTAQLDPNKVVAIVLESGGRTSHSAIIARAMGIPAVVKVEGILDSTQTNQDIVVDGKHGKVWLEISDQDKQQLVDEQAAWQAQNRAKMQHALEPAVTTTGTSVDVHANIGGLGDVEKALASGAEGVGLLRTEFIFQEKTSLPTEDEQFTIYRDIASALGQRPLTIRSLDVGGDKPLDSYPMAEEENPFLGLRGVRLCLTNLELFKPQIKAVLRAAEVQPNIQLMIPMISTVEELVAVKAIVAQCRTELGFDEERAPLKVGIMIEVPAAVFNACELAQHADFFSIGTNDLTQYVMAADRGNTQVANLVDYTQSAVLSAIKMTCDAAIAQGIPVSMCGEMAGDDAMTSILLKLGVQKFSASASVLPSLKAKIRSL